MDFTKLDDATLIRLIVRADADAVSELYDRYSRLIFSLALAAVGDHSAAEEITLDVFTRVWEKASTYRGEQGRVTTWLTSIARHRSIDVLRRRGARRETQTIEWTELVSDAEPSVNGPEEIAELTMQRQRLRIALAQLPPEQRQVLGLAYFQGYTHSQIAEALGQPLGTVKTRIRLAMQKLRESLQEGPLQS